MSQKSNYKKDISQEQIKQYLHDIGQYKLLDEEEEKGLFEKLQTKKEAEKKLNEMKNLSSHPEYGTEEDSIIKDLEKNIKEGLKARKILINSNLRLVISIITSEKDDKKDKKEENKQVKKGDNKKNNLRLNISLYDDISQIGNEFLTPEDLIQYGALHLTELIDKFDPNKGTRFSTYAYPIIAKELREHLKNIKNEVLDKNVGLKRYLIARKSLKMASNDPNKEPKTEDIAKLILEEKYSSKGKLPPIGIEWENKLKLEIKNTRILEAQYRRLITKPTSLHDKDGNALPIKDRQNIEEKAISLASYDNIKGIAGQNLQRVLGNLKTEDEIKVFTCMFIKDTHIEESEGYTAYINKDLSSVIEDLQSPELPKWRIEQIYHRIMRLYRLPSKFNRLKKAIK